jgi:exonuclease SbcD
MKILHTADWHIGKVLHKQSLQAELNLFFDWLLGIIEEESINILLISGDIFDLANPSASDRALYYGFLKRLVSLKLKIIITGGNHDAVGLLNAPKEILASLDINVIGGATSDIRDELITIKSSDGSLLLDIAAVPFLRDKDLRNKESDEKYKSRTEAIRAGIHKHYRSLYEIHKKENPTIPIIAMGHLFAVGAKLSDSERDIHVGNTASVDESIFSGYEYVALGHIHKPQRVAKKDHIRYSGSPIALSFSERDDQKCILIIELENNKLKPAEKIVVPKSRELKKIKGSLEKVTQQLASYDPNYLLRSFVEIEVQEESFSALTLSKVEQLNETYEDNSKFSILKSKTSFSKGMKDTSDLYIEGSNIEDLAPKDVFDKRLEQEELDPGTQENLREAFLELLEKVEQAEQL